MRIERPKRSRLSLGGFVWILAVCVLSVGQPIVYAEVPARDPVVAIAESFGAAIDSIGEYFGKAMIVIIPGPKEKVWLGKFTDFSSDSTKFLEESRRIKVSQIAEELLPRAKGDIQTAYHVFIFAHRDISYDHLHRVVSEYDAGLRRFPGVDNFKLIITIGQPFSDVRELQGFQACKSGTADGCETPN